MTTADIQHRLDRLEAVGQGDRPDLRAAVTRRHLEALLCAAQLREAIDRAERWYAQREDGLRRFDQRAAATVLQLVRDAQVRPSLAWSAP